MLRALGSLSLRGRVFGALLALQLLPLLVVAFATWFLRDQNAVKQRRAESTLIDALAALDAQANRPFDQRLPQLEEVARGHKVRIRVVDASTLLHTTQNYHKHLDPTGIITDLFDPRIADEMSAIDASQPPLWQFPEVATAFATGSYSGCSFRSVGEPPLPLVGQCIAAQRCDTAAGPRVIVAEDVYRRNFRILHDVRRQAAQLALGVLFSLVIPGGLILSLQIAQPIRQLSIQCRERASGNSTLSHVKARGYPEIEELANAFNHLLSTLVERNKQNEAFVADVAHELKSPLAALRACAERLQQPEPIQPAQQLRVAAIMMTSCERMNFMVTQFLDLTRIDAGLPAEERVPLSFDELVRVVVSEVERNPRFESVHFETQLEAAPVHGVPGRLESAVRNLLDNAATFALRSPVARQVRVTLCCKKEGIQLQVQDSGPGIPPEHRANLFRRFFTTEQHGTGLGLAMTRAIFEAHGGSVNIAADTPGGACFTATISRFSAGAG